MTARPMEAASPWPRGLRDNILIRACGEPLSSVEIARKLLYLPPTPDGSGSYSRHDIEHMTAGVFRMHIPTPAGIELAHAVSFMLAEGYVSRDPSSASTWRRIYSGIGDQAATSPIQLGAMVTGVSGAGKSMAIERALNLFPRVVHHESIPGLAVPSPQLVWLKVDVPPSGKIKDLVETLARQTDEALGTSNFDRLLHGKRPSGAEMAHRWLRMISCNFLGILVLDEVQNLFKIETKAVRSAVASRRHAAPPPLRIVDDEALKFLLTLSNYAKIPTIYCATPDGKAALETRMSTAQRMLTAGLHTIPHARSADDEFFRKHFFPRLCQYQWLPQKLPASDEFRRLLFDLSAGVPKIAAMTWFNAVRRALQRRADCMSLEDFRHAAETALGPLRPAVAALLSGDPRQLQRYEDLMGGV